MYKVFGYHLVLNLYECNPEKLKDGEFIKNTIIQLCDLIKMKRYGDCILEHFGESEDVKGYTAVQLIETSNIIAHFVEKTNKIFFDVFSCKDFESEPVIQFLKEAFEAKESSYSFLIRD